MTASWADRRRLLIDLETYSSVDISKAGAFKYVEAPDFEIMLLAYVWNDGPVQVIEMRKALPRFVTCERDAYFELQDVIAGILDPDTVKVAHNSAFERACLTKHLGQELPAEEWEDTMILAAMNGLPMSLEAAGAALNIEQQKLKEQKPVLQGYVMDEVYNKMERQSGRTKDVVWGKLGVLVEAHDSTGLFTFLDTVINERPNEYEYQIYKGDCYAEVYNRPDLAEDIYKGILEHSPANKQAQYALISHYTRIQDLDKLFESVKRLVSNNHIEENIRTEILTNYIRYCVSEDSLRLNSVRSFLDNMDYGENATGEISATHVVLLSYMNAAPDSILLAINRTLKYHPEDTEIRRHGMYLCYRRENTDELLRLCEEGQYYDPKNLDYYHLPAIFYLYDENYDAAIKTLERGEPYYMENPDDSLASELYNLMGDIYHDLGRMEECYAAYDSALALIPDNALVLNNYAYFLSLKDKRLDKALAMSTRATELEPNNATYVDTHAWVLHRLGRNEEAKSVMSTALSLSAQRDDSLLAHYGDILWALGEEFMADTYWKKAVSQGYDKEAMDEHIAEIKSKREAKKSRKR